MGEHARLMCTGGIEDSGEASSSRSVLNVGFGMGIIDTAIQGFAPKHHTIIGPAMVPFVVVKDLPTAAAICGYIHKQAAA